MVLLSNDSLRLNLTSQNDDLKLDLTPQGNLNLKLGVPKTISGTNDYEKLKNKPQIESIELIGNKTFPDLGISPINSDDLLEILI